MIEQVQAIFAPGGELDRVFPDREPRPQQEKLAIAVADAYDNGTTLFAQAPTAVGKSLAYLIPSALAALAGRGPVVVATATKSLQRQIMDKEAETLRAIWPDLRVASLQGRDNYVSWRRLSLAPANTNDELLDVEAHEARRIHELDQWEGDRAELAPPPAPRTWEAIESTALDCQNERCATFGSCAWWTAKRAAARAHVLVVNHAILAIDARLRWLRGAGMGILPPYKLLVVDEAHRLRDTLARAWGADLGVGSFLKPLRKVEERGIEHAALIARIRAAAPECFDALGKIAGQESRLLVPEDVQRVHVATNELYESTLLLSQALELNQEERPIAERLRRAASELQGAGMCDLTDGLARWVVHGRYPRLHAAPLEIAKRAKERLWDRLEGVALTSATLAPGGDLLEVARDLGLDDPVTLDLPHQLDYSRAWLGVAGEDAPSPEKGETDQYHEHTAYVARIVSAAAIVARGATMALFTSRAQRDEVARIAEPDLVRAGLRVLVQGRDGGNTSLVETFRRGGAVLFGTNAFWEGVDFPEDELVCLVLAKVPFPNRSDPYGSARRAALGLNAFRLLDMPAARLALAQGFGRLLRRANDRGAVLLLDRRVVEKRWGAEILAAIPPKTNAFRGREAKLIDMVRHAVAPQPVKTGGH